MHFPPGESVLWLFVPQRSNMNRPFRKQLSNRDSLRPISVLWKFYATAITFCLTARMHFSMKLAIEEVRLVGYNLAFSTFDSASKGNFRRNRRILKSAFCAFYESRIFRLLLISKSKIRTEMFAKDRLLDIWIWTN